MKAPIAILSFVLMFAPHGDLHKQIVQLDAKVAAQPKQVALRLRRGELLRLHGEHIKALKDFQVVLDLEPKNVAVLLMKGRLFLDMKKHKAAAKELAAFLVLMPRSPEGLRFSAQNELARGHAIRAVAFYQTLLSSGQSGRPEDILFCARTMLKVPEMGLEGGLQFLNEQLTQRGSIFVLELEALKFEKSLRQYDSALKRISRLARKQKRQDLWTVRKAEVHQLSGRTKLELSAWKLALTQLKGLSRNVKNRPNTIKSKIRIEKEIRRASVATTERKK